MFRGSEWDVVIGERVVLGSGEVFTLKQMTGFLDSHFIVKENNNVYTTADINFEDTVEYNGDRR